MIKNKKSLLKSANSVKWSVDRKVLLSIKKELFRIPVLLDRCGNNDNIS